jgi:DNA-binding IclR family transcriptional regulator
LQQIRARGYARSASEADEMASAIAFPVTGRDGATVMALAISGPVQQFHDAALPRLIAMTRDCAARLSASYARYQDAARPHRSNGAAHADHRA